MRTSVFREPLPLCDIAAALNQLVGIGKHTGGFMNLKTYDDVFVGSAAIEALVHNGFAATRPEAQRLGNSLIAEGYMRHVKDSKQPLKDKSTSYYRCFFVLTPMSPITRVRFATVSPDSPRRCPVSGAMVADSLV